MKPLFLALLLQLPLAQLSMQSGLQLKIRLEIIIATTFSGKANEKALKEALLMLTEEFAIDQQYTRMALLDYDGTVIRRISLTDSRHTVVGTINDIRNRPNEIRSRLDRALDEMFSISETQGRTNALKLFIVITHKRPTKGEGVDSDTAEGVIASKEIFAAGLFFIIYDYKPDYHASIISYFKELCGEENLITLAAMEGIVEKIQSRIVTKVLDRACKYRERRCYFTNSTTKTCRSYWHYTDGYMTNEDCQKTRYDANPSACQIDECYQMCDYYWPWQQNFRNCHCGVQIGRQGNMPFAELSNCEKVMNCTACGSVSATATVAVAVAADKQTDRHAFGGGVPTWAIGLIVVAFVAAIVGIAFAGMKFMKQDSVSKKRRGNRHKPGVRRRRHSTGNAPVKRWKRSTPTVLMRK